MKNRPFHTRTFAYEAIFQLAHGSQHHFYWERVGEMKKWPPWVTVCVNDKPFFQLATTYVWHPPE
jgi:hypothetical protein